MSKKIVIELSMYSDGDWGYDESIFENHTSRYFDNDLYEYTYFEWCTTKIKRSFDLGETDGYNAIRSILNAICSSLHGRQSDVKYVTEFFDRAIERLPNVSVENGYYDSMESNTEIDLTIRIIESDAKEIKEIIYKE